MRGYFKDDIMVIFNLIGHRINDSEKLRLIGEELSHRKAAVIGIVDEFGDKPVYQKDIGRILRIRRSTATSMLQDMEKEGLIIRQIVGDDLRLKQIVLTEKAMDYAKIIKEEFRMIENLIVKDFSEEEKAQLKSFFERIKNNLIVDRRHKCSKNC